MGDRLVPNMTLPESMLTQIYVAIWHMASLSHNVLTHWGRVTHICISQLITIVSDNGLSPDRRQASIWNNDGILLFGPMGRNFSEILKDI